MLGQKAAVTKNHGAKKGMAGVQALKYSIPAARIDTQGWTGAEPCLSVMTDLAN